MPDFSNPEVQYNTLIIVLTFIGGMVGKKIPVLGPIIDKITLFFRALKPAPTPQAAVCSAADKVQAATEELKVAVVNEQRDPDTYPPLPPMDRDDAVMHVTELGKFFTTIEPDAQSAALVNQVFARLHTPKVVAE